MDPVYRVLANKDLLRHIGDYNADILDVFAAKNRNAGMRSRLLELKITNKWLDTAIKADNTTAIDIVYNSGVRGIRGAYRLAATHGKLEVYTRLEKTHQRSC